MLNASSRVRVDPYKRSQVTTDPGSGAPGSKFTHVSRTRPQTGDTCQ